jgi:fucose 4-O-acetylase-like acetyltransferase
MANTIAPPPAYSAGLVWVDAAKGIGILLVVIGHVLRGMANANLIGNTTAFHAVDFAIYSFHMPLFFFLSGLLTKFGRAPVTQLRGLATDVVYPYFLWSAALVIMQVLTSGLSNNPVGLKAYLSILWSPISPFWFLYVLFILRVTVLVLPSPKAMATLCAAAYVGSLFLNPGLAQDLTYSALFFGLGCLVRELYPDWIVVQKNTVAAVLVIVMAWVGGLLILLWLDVSDYRALICLPLTLAGIAMVLSASEGLSGRAQRFAAYLGQRSMAIYVAHIFFTAGTRIVMDRFLHMTSEPAHLIAGTLIGLAGPLLLYELATRLKVTRQLGLGRRL